MNRDQSKDTGQETKVLLYFIGLGLALSLCLALAMLHSPRAKFSSSKGERKQSSDVVILYQNLGTATKAMFFHDLKKTKP